MSHSKYLIYGLVDPDTNQLRYVGKSCSGLYRPRSHWSEGTLQRERNREKKNWLLQLKSQGKVPKVIIIEDVGLEAELNAAEIFYIMYLRSVGCSLTNILPGGEGFDSVTGRNAYYARSAESRERSKQKMLEGAIMSNVRGRNNLRLRKPIIATHVETNEQRWYLSASHAAADGLGSRSAISNCLRPSWRCKSNKGWVFSKVTN